MCVINQKCYGFKKDFDMRRLHWGCGPITPYGWINSDVCAFPGVNVVADIRRGLPFPADEFEMIVSIHALPELAYSELDAALQELLRVLKPGGVLRLSLPDMQKAIQALLTKDVDYFFLIGDDVIRSLSGKMIVQLLWYGQSRCMFTVEFITELLERNGFVNIQECRYRETCSSYPSIIELDNREIESIFIEASKPSHGNVSSLTAG
jgi:SAM-dependent methyltransferase